MAKYEIVKKLCDIFMLMKHVSKYSMLILQTNLFTYIFLSKQEYGTNVDEESSTTISDTWGYNIEVGLAFGEVLKVLQ